MLDPGRLGALVTKSITREPRAGHPPWRLIDVPQGMLNAVGLANVGMHRFLTEKLPGAERVNTVVIGSIAGNSVEDYCEVAAAFDAEESLPIVELNVSCPNTDDGIVFGEDPGRLAGLLRDVRHALPRTKMFVKLSPNVGDVTAFAAAAVEAGADGVTLINSVAGMGRGGERRSRRLRGGRGV